MFRAMRCILIACVILSQTTKLALADKAKVESYRRYLPAEAVLPVMTALSQIDYSEAAMARAPHVMFVSAESTAGSGLEIRNRVHRFKSARFDIWLMRQRQNRAEGERAETWSLVSIVVDHARRPPAAYFLEFAAEPVHTLPRTIEPRVPCLRCHPNGPRSLRPMRASSHAELSASDRSTLAAFNHDIAASGVVEAYRPDGNTWLDEPAAGAQDVLPLSACQQCHDPVSGIRNALRRQHEVSILFLTSHGTDSHGFTVEAGRAVQPAMPLDDDVLTSQESDCLDRWLRQKPLVETCAAKRSVQSWPMPVSGSPAKGARTLFIDAAASRLRARVLTSLGSFEVEGIAPAGSIGCNETWRKCRGAITLPIATASTGINVRDRHLQQLLSASKKHPTMTVELTSPDWLELANGIAHSLDARLSVAGRAASIAFDVRCTASAAATWACDIKDSIWDMRRHGIIAPGFLGIHVEPVVAISGRVVLHARQSSTPRSKPKA